MSRFAKFACVGLSGTAVNFFTLIALVQVAGLPAVGAAPIATELAILSNFALNDTWTFGGVGTRHGVVGRALRYNTICLGGLLISVSVLAVMHELAGVHYLAANLAGIGCGTLWNYGANTRLTWSQPLRLAEIRLALSPRQRARRRLDDGRGV